MRREGRRLQGRRRHLDHHPHEQAGRPRCARPVQGAVERAPRGQQLVHRADHREHHAHRGVHGHPHDRQQLVRQQARNGEREADAADAQEGIALGRGRQVGQRLVAPDVERAQRDPTPAHSVGDAAIDRLLLFDVGRLLPVQEEELRADEPGQVCAQLSRQPRVLDRAEVRADVHLDAVGRPRRLRRPLSGGLSGRCELLRPAPEADEHGVVRTDHQLAGRSVERHQGALRRGQHARSGSDHGGDAQAADEDRAVRGGAAGRQHHTDDARGVQRDGFGRRQVHRDEHPCGRCRAAIAGRSVGADAQQGAQHLLAHGADVVGALPQVGVGQRLEGRLHLLHRCRPRGRSRLARVDPPAGVSQQGAVVQQQQQRVEQGGALLPHRRGGLRPAGPQVGAAGGPRRSQAGPLARRIQSSLVQRVSNRGSGHARPRGTDSDAGRAGRRTPGDGRCGRSLPVRSGQRRGPFGPLVEAPGGQCDQGVQDLARARSDGPHFQLVPRERPDRRHPRQARRRYPRLIPGGVAHLDDCVGRLGVLHEPGSRTGMQAVRPSDQERRREPARLGYSSL